MFSSESAHIDLKNPEHQKVSTFILTLTKSGGENKKTMTEI